VADAQARGSLALVLHAHLPFVRHPEYESFLEETWLFEAITETYLPLLRVFDRLVAEGIRFRITLSLSPPLLTMLADPFLQDRYRAHLDKMAELGDKEILRNHPSGPTLDLARMYRGLVEQTRDDYDNTHGRDLIGAFGRLQDAGAVELITCGATHGFLPLLRSQPSAVRAQVGVAADAYERAFGRRPAGLWLPECGYFPGIEEVLAEEGIRYFFVEAHGLLNATPAPKYAVLAPLSAGKDVAAFGRDPSTSRIVWSADEGYPGDPWYRDFYRDIGFDLDFDIIKPFILDGETRVATGFKYHRITGATDDKLVYEPERARERAAEHAGDFVSRVRRIVESAAPRMDRPPIVVAPYDAELFGHWWFEGPQWLDYVIRKLAFDQDVVALATAGDDLDRHPDPQPAQPVPSSWGDQGYNDFWLNPGNDWIYPHLHDAAARMQNLARTHTGAETGTLLARALAQAARSLLLAQASDWAFIMKTGTNVEYAYGRTRDHLGRFHFLADAIDAGDIDERKLAALELMDDIFPDVDWSVYA